METPRRVNRNPLWINTDALNKPLWLDKTWRRMKDVTGSGRLRRRMPLASQPQLLAPVNMGLSGY
jgi:hypothetical protein